MVLSDEILGRKPAYWPKFLIGVFVVPFVCYIFNMSIVVAIFALNSSGAISIETNNLIWGEGASRPGNIVFTFSFIAIFHIFLWVFMRFAYGRKYLSLLNPLKLPWRAQAKWAFFYTMLMMLGTEVGAMIIGRDASHVDFVWNLKEWLIWLLPIFLIVLLQTSAEEFFFRGFMQQYLARLVSRRWIYIVLPSLLWASLHIGNYKSPAVSIPVTFSIFIMGLVFADWADRAGSLYGPVFVHFLNNFILIAIYGNTIEPSDMNIWRYDANTLNDAQIGILGIVSAVSIAFAYLLLRERISCSASEFGE